MNDIITIALKAFPVIALITTGVVLEKTALFYQCDCNARH